MKVVILAGGLGTRLGEETSIRPKPLVEVGGVPILWHIMKYYSSFGHNEFILCLGYKGFMIKEYFMSYMAHFSDMTIDLENNVTEYNYKNHKKEPWKVHLIHTGDTAMTGARVKRIESYIGKDEAFLMTYGDGVCDVDINAEIDFHKKHGKIGTMLGVKPPGRFGALELEGNIVKSFKEKPQGDGGYINGGFFVFNKELFKYLNDGDDLIFEQEPLRNLASDGQLASFLHEGHWQCMDTLRDKLYLEEMWNSGKAFWKK